MRAVEKLRTIQVNKLTKPGYHSDGGGLYLQVSVSGTKSWIFTFKRNGRRREMGLGPFTLLSLAEARQKAAECRHQLLDGQDPIASRQAQRTGARVAAAKNMTFKQCAEKCIEDRRAEWSNAKHATQWENTLLTYAYPYIGSLPVSDIDTGLVRQCLDPIWATKTETASRVRQRIETVLDWAKVHGYRSGDNPATWRGHLDAVMAKPKKLTKPENHAALPYSALPEFMMKLRKHEGLSAIALELLILTATRTGEVLGAQWSELDLKAATWTIPRERMKAGVEHIVPLSARAIVLLKQRSKVKDGSEWVFPGARPGRPLSNMSMLELVRGMGIKDEKGEPATVHGFRSTFRQWAAECTSYPREVAEHALAHRLPDKVEAAYQRSTLLAKRKQLMDEWSAYATSKKFRGAK